MTRKGKVIGFGGSWGSGLGTLSIEDEEGYIHNIPCDNGPTVRALEDAFGNFITENHTVDTKSIKGKKIFYEITDYGLLAGFTPEDEATIEIIEDYEKEE